MKKLPLLLFLILSAGICFSQQIAFKGEKTWFDGSLYRIQIGAYKNTGNAERAFALLKNSGLDPQYGEDRQLRRVVLNRVRARDIPRFADTIRELGFREVWITRENTISEKWEIDDPDSKYASFEFNDSSNYIVVETSQNRNNPVVHFGDYTIHDRHTIELQKLGLLNIQSSDNTGVSFSFTEEGNTQPIRYEGKKAEPVSTSVQTGLFSKVWKIVSVDEVVVEPGSEHDKTFLFSIAGTYLVTDSHGNTAIAQWRWKDTDEIDFQYSWDRWADYGNCTVEILNSSEMVVVDSTYGSYMPTPQRLRLVPFH